MSKALQTKMLGYATDRTGHVMAPMEVVYDVDTPRRPNWLQKGVVLVSLAGCIWIFANAIAEVLF